MQRLPADGPQPLRPRPSRGCAAALVCALAAPAPAAAAPPRTTPEDPFAVARRQTSEATKFREEKNFAREIELLTSAHQTLAAMPPDTRNGIVWLLAAALRRQWEQDSDTAHLDAALTLLDAHLRALGTADSESLRSARERTASLIAELSRLRGTALYQQALVSRRGGDRKAVVAGLEQALLSLEAAAALTDPLAREVVDNLVTAHQEAFSETMDSGHIDAARTALQRLRTAWQASTHDGRADQLARLDAQLAALQRLPIAALHQSAGTAAAAGDRRRAAELWTRALADLTALGQLADPLGVAIVEAAANSAIAAMKAPVSPRDDSRSLLTGAQTLARSYLADCPRAPAASTPCELQRVQKIVAELEKFQRPDPDPDPTPPPARRPAHRPFVISGAALAALGVGGLAVMGAGLGLGKRAERDLESAKATTAETMYKDIIDGGNLANKLAWAGGVVGGVMLVTGTALLVVGLRHPKQSRLAVHPVLSSRLAGVVLGMRF